MAPERLWLGGMFLSLLGSTCVPAQPHQDSSLPGEWIRTEAELSPDQAARQCVSLSWNKPRETLSDSIVSRACRVRRFESLGRIGSVIWQVAIVEHVSVFGADSQTRVEDLKLFPDTVREEEIVIFTSGRAKGTIRAIWHDRHDSRYEHPGLPRIAAGSGAHFLELVTCVDGTGGCRWDVFRLKASVPWQLVQQAYAPQIRALLPEGWGLWKGVRPFTDSLIAHGWVYLPGDGNCCPLFTARARLTLQNDTLRLERLDLVPDTTYPSSHRTILPGARVGAIGPETTEDQLVRWFGPEAVARRPVHLGEGICSPGTLVLEGKELEAEVAWADSARTRVAFVRIGRHPSAWRTTRGVTIGTTLAELQRLQGSPVAFSGFGWDYGGSGSWTEPLPLVLDSTGKGSIGIRLAPDSASDERLDQLGSDPRVRELYGNRQVMSDHLLLRGLTIEVRQLVQPWAEAAIQLDCDKL
ncbi:MAG TPA: hypothetical protein VGA78_00375 [Gemmatimonadales bacterium]